MPRPSLNRTPTSYSAAGFPPSAAARNAGLPIAFGSLSAALAAGSEAARWLAGAAAPASGGGSDPVTSLVRMAGVGASRDGTLSRTWESAAGITLLSGIGDSRNSSPVALDGRRAAAGPLSGTTGSGASAARDSLRPAAAAGFAPAGDGVALERDRGASIGTK